MPKSRCTETMGGADGFLNGSLVLSTRAVVTRPLPRTGSGLSASSGQSGKIAGLFVIEYVDLMNETIAGGRCEFGSSYRQMSEQPGYPKLLRAFRRPRTAGLTPTICLTSKAAGIRCPSG